MKRIIVIILTIALALCEFGCSSNRSHYSDNDQYYAVKSETKRRTPEEEALLCAESYLDTDIGYSAEKLTKQLKFEGFSDSESQYAVEHCSADWNRQALISANNYLNLDMGWSKTKLKKQLEFEGFSSSQIEYALDYCNCDW